jgi:hypothetical protein
MKVSALKRDIDVLITHIQMTFEEMLYQQKEFVIFDEKDLEHKTTDNYLEIRDKETGNVFDVHPLKVLKVVNYHDIEVVTADGNFTKHSIKIWDLSLEDRINLIDLMDKCLVDNDSER